MDFSEKEVAMEIPTIVRVYKDGLVERLVGSPFVPPSPEDPETGVSSKDITISQHPPISARAFLPRLPQPHHKLPILIYFHGGGFCVESAGSVDHTRCLNRLVAAANVVAVSVEYRLAPEHPLPIPYDDCWAALRWVVSHGSNECVNEEPWLSTYGDFGRIHIGGDSTGANIVHNILLRVGKEGLRGGLKIDGALLTNPYFWGSSPVGSEPKSKEEREKLLTYLTWIFLNPSIPGGIDSPMVNPVAPRAPSLAGLGCSRMFVGVAEKDLLRDRGILYYNAIKESGWRGEVELVDVKGEDHAFHILAPESENTPKMIKQMASFLSGKR